MSGYGDRDSPAHSTHAPDVASTVSLPFLVLAAVLIGVGIAGMAYWLVTFDWLYFAAVVPLVVGAYMLFTRGSGPDRA